MDLRGHVRLIFTIGIRRSQLNFCASTIIQCLHGNDQSNSEDSSYMKARVYTSLIEETTEVKR